MLNMLPEDVCFGFRSGNPRHPQLAEDYQQVWDLGIKSRPTESDWKPEIEMANLEATLSTLSHYCGWTDDVGKDCLK